MNEPCKPMALVVRAAPYQQSYPRSQLDVALALATLEIPLSIFFLGEGIWQLVASRAPESAGLARGLKGWAALSGMTKVDFFADPDRIQRVAAMDMKLLVPVQELDSKSMAKRWNDCQQVMAI